MERTREELIGGNGGKALPSRHWNHLEVGNNVFDSNGASGNRCLCPNEHRTDDQTKIDACNTCVAHPSHLVSRNFDNFKRCPWVGIAYSFISLSLAVQIDFDGRVYQIAISGIVQHNPEQLSLNGRIDIRNDDHQTSVDRFLRNNSDICASGTIGAPATRLRTKSST